MDKPIVFNPALHSHLIPSFVSVHMSCITKAPYAIATFKPPLDASRMQTWWEDRVQEVVAGKRDIFLQMGSNPATGEEELAGLVSLSIPFSETGPFRGDVEKLLVSPEHRRKGIAKALMAKLEEAARAKGRTLLSLDAVTGEPAEKIYPKLGYIQVGIIPEYAFAPDGSLKGATFFYKNLLAESNIA